MNAPKILVIEDSEMTQETVRALFSSLGCEVTTVISGEEAMEKLGYLKPDLIILDLKLPGMSGIDFYRGIALNAKWKGTPIIPFTSQWNEYWGQDKPLAGDLMAATFATKRVFGENTGIADAVSKGPQGESVSTVPNELVFAVGSALLKSKNEVPQKFREALDILLDKKRRLV